jgi:2-C-methyl-D-erythritol 4-phosphate cytidylyltransferase
MRASAAITVVAIAAPPGHEQALERIAGAIAGRPDEPGAFHPIVVSGGDSRSASVGLALAEVPAEAELVAVHDAARPLVTGEMVDALVARLGAEGAAAGVIAATPVSDTLKQVGNGEGIVATVERDGLWAAQTPQVFRSDVLRAAHDGDPAKVAGATDDASLVEADGGRVVVHAMEGPNLKVTTAADLRLAELLLADRG